MRQPNLRRASHPERVRFQKFEDAFVKKHAANHETDQDVGVGTGWCGNFFPEAHKMSFRLTRDSYAVGKTLLFTKSSKARNTVAWFSKQECSFGAFCAYRREENRQRKKLGDHKESNEAVQ